MPLLFFRAGHLQCSAHWPGDIRELENILEQSVVLNDGKSELQLVRKLSANNSQLSANTGTLDEIKNVQREMEKEYITSALRKAKGRIRGANGAAELLNIKPTTLESKMAKLNIRKQDYTSAAGNT